MTLAQRQSLQALVDRTPGEIMALQWRGVPMPDLRAAFEERRREVRSASEDEAP